MAKKIVRVVGHKNPDTDSICAAIAYANLKSQIDDTVEYIPMRAGSISARQRLCWIISRLIHLRF